MFLITTINWPAEKSETKSLIGILLISLPPILLALVEVIIERGGVIKAGSAKIYFLQVPQMGVSGFTAPLNIVVPGQSVSATVQSIKHLPNSRQ